MPLFVCRKVPDGTAMSGDAAACAAEYPRKMAAAQTIWRARMSPLAGRHLKEREGWDVCSRGGRGCGSQRRSHLGRMRADDRFVDGGAPAWAVRQEKLAVVDHVGLGEELGFPRHLVDVELHDAEIGYSRAEMRAHDIGQWTVEIMRGNVDLVGVGHDGHPRRLNEPIPLRVDDGDVDRVIFEVRLEIAAAEDPLERSDRRGRRLPDQTERLGLE